MAHHFVELAQMVLPAHIRVGRSKKEMVGPVDHADKEHDFIMAVQSCHELALSLGLRTQTQKKGLEQTEIDADKLDLNNTSQNIDLQISAEHNKLNSNPHDTHTEHTAASNRYAHMWRIKGLSCQHTPKIQWGCQLCPG